MTNEIWARTLPLHVRVSLGDPDLSVGPQWLDQLPFDFLSLPTQDPGQSRGLPGGMPALAPLLATQTATQSAAGMVTNAVGDNGDQAMDGPSARSSYDVTGVGIKIGIISDSFDAGGANAAAVAAEEADGDLPSTVTVLNEGPSGETDEGRAMAELAHKVAPGAQIYFSSADSTSDTVSGEQAFANSILSLEAAGCTIIVDDVTYLAEPFFQEGNVIQNAIQTVVADGVSYFTAASNEGTEFYQGTIAMTSGTLPDGTTGQMQNFGTAEAAISGSDVLQQITIDGESSIDIDLQWTQPFRDNGSTGIIGSGSAYSLELLLYSTSGGAPVATATVDEVGSDPVQILSYSNTSGNNTAFNLAIVLNGGAISSGSLKYIIYGNATINDANAGEGSGTVTGHELLADVNTVAAANAATPGSAESFSSVGPGELFYNASGTLLSTPSIENKVNFTAPDGIMTSVTSDPNLENFYGTSAAAPDAAAVGALMQQLNPNLTPAEVTAALEATATQMDGGADPDKNGAGFVNADAALQDVFGSAWAVGGGGDWSSAAGWSSTTEPASATYVTLADDQESLVANYTVTVDIATAAADTVTVGNAASITATLLVLTGEKLAVAGGATVGQDGSVTVAGTLTIGTALQLQGASAAPATFTVQANGSLSAASFAFESGSISVGSGAHVAASSASFGGSGTVTLGGSGTLTVSGTSTIAASIGSTELLSMLTGARLSTGALDVATGAIDLASGALLSTGSITLGAAGSLSIAGEVNSSATLTGTSGAQASVLSGGILAISGSIAGSEAITVDSGGTLSIGNQLSGGEITLDGGALLDLTTTSSTTLKNHLAGATIVLGTGAPAKIDLTGLTFSASDTLTTPNNGIVSIKSGSGTLATFRFASPDSYRFALGEDSSGHEELSVACYVSGTRIATPSGETPIDDLCIGDAVLTAGGRVRKIHWIGRRGHDAGAVARDRAARPIRIRTGALGVDRPRRDLLVSPQHALLLRDGAQDVLVPACQLVNGISIVRCDAAGPVNYLHIELPAHDAILAEGQPAETFLDDASRGAFDNADEYVALYPTDVMPRPTTFCAPRVEHGPVLGRLRAAIDARAGLRPGTLAGNIDQVDRWHVGGWARDRGRPNAPVLLEVAVDGDIVAVLLADGYRSDLAEPGLSDGYCGFDVRLPKPLSDTQRHIISVRRAADRTELRGSPLLLDRPAPVPEVLARLTRPADAAGRAELAGFLARQIDRLRRARAA